MNIHEAARFAYNDRVVAEEAFFTGVALRELKDVIGEEWAHLIQVVAVTIEGQPKVVFLSVEGMHFKVQVNTSEHVSYTAGSEGLTYESWKTEVQVGRGQGWYPVKDLSEVGKLFKEDELPEPELA